MTVLHWKMRLSVHNLLILFFMCVGVCWCAFGCVDVLLAVGKCVALPRSE